MADSIIQTGGTSQVATVWTGDIEADCYCVDFAVISCHPSARLMISFYHTNLNGSANSASPHIITIPNSTNSHYDSGSEWGCYASSISSCIRQRLTSVEIEIDDPTRIPDGEAIEYKVCIWAALSDEPADLGSGCNDNCYNAHTAGDGLNDRIAIYKTV